MCACERSGENQGSDGSSERSTMTMGQLGLLDYSNFNLSEVSLYSLTTPQHAV